MAKAFDKIMDGLTDALAYAEGDKKRGKAHQVAVDVPDVKAIRESTGLSQTKFAETYLLSADNIRQWEQGRRQPDRSARVLLHLIAKDPAGVAEDLSELRA
ncbi:helix-turn-helix domain-containing protein [Hwanghaeella sp.]|uniref:helix-turn-helix domain-containing protein n=1 Tax=Hwanghaeella sp. TaxID=2605943 RepID=UPI003CCBEDA6